VGILAPGHAEPAVVTRRSALVAAIALAAAIVVGIVLTAPEPRAPALPASGIRATAEVNPQSAYFGDTLVARVDVLVDRRRIDPSTLALRGSLKPYGAPPPTIERRDIGDVTRMTYTLRLRCLERACLPPMPDRGGRRTFVLPGLELLYERTGGARDSVLLSLPALEIISRLTQSDAALVDDFLVIPFRASPTLGRVDYAISPTLLVVLLLVGAAALFALAGRLLLRYGRRPREPVPEPPSAPPAVVSPLERALAVVEQARTRGSVTDERKALELLARELGRSGAAELAVTAKGLAWSAPGPTAEATHSLAADVRGVIDRNGDGRAQ
jgi:hypothetical protein